MHFQDLFYFSEAVKCGNISKAAKELQVSRQTITATLSRLEKEIGYPGAAGRRRACAPVQHMHGGADAVHKGGRFGQAEGDNADPEPGRA